MEIQSNQFKQMENIRRIIVVVNSENESID